MRLISTRRWVRILLNTLLHNGQAVTEITHLHMDKGVHINICIVQTPKRAAIALCGHVGPRWPHNPPKSGQHTHTLTTHIQ